MKWFSASILALLVSVNAADALLIDGHDILQDFTNPTWFTYQDVAPGWPGAEIMAMYVKTNATHLLVGIPGYAINTDGRCVILLIDENPLTGSNAVPAGLNGLTHVKGMAGLHWDDAFTPDRTVTLAVEASGRAYIDCEDIFANSAAYLGLIDNVASGGSVSNAAGSVIGACMPWAYVLEETNTANEGLEIALAYDAIINNSPTVRLMAVVVNFNGDWTSNHTLPPSGTNTVGRPSAEQNYALVPGDQYLTIALPVTHTTLGAVASQTQTRLFAQSSLNTFSVSALGGFPPYAFHWELGDGFATSAPAFSYTYPGDGVFDSRVIITDTAGQSLTDNVGAVTVMPATFVDGLAIPTDFAGHGTSVVQDTASNWGEVSVPGTGSELDRLHAFSQDDTLYLGVCGNMYTGMSDRVLCVFIDSSSAIGSNVLPDVTAGNPAKLANLVGLTFDQQFSPDKALLFSIGQWHEYWVDYYEIDGNTNTWWSDKTEWHNIFDPFQRSFHLSSNVLAGIAAFNDNTTVDNPAAATNGFEAQLHYDLLYHGMPEGAHDPTLRVQVVIFNYETGYLANQSLPGIAGNSAGYGPATSVNYDLVPGRQYIEIAAPIIPECGAGIVVLLALASTRARRQ